MKKSDIYGVVGSVIACVLLLLLLLFIYMPGMKTPEDEGILVSFGDSFDGGGAPAANFQEAQPAEQTPAASDNLPQPSTTQEDLLTQTDNSLEIAKQKEEEKKKKAAQEEAERKKKQEEQRLAEERRLQEEQRIAEENRRRQEATDRANALISGNTFNGSGTGGTAGADQRGTGSGTGDNQQGNPVGRGISDGSSWSLEGRRLIGKIEKPNDRQNVEGVITVTIRVDGNGQVVGASIGSPTTISNNITREATLAVARKTKFTAGEGISTGTITYNFKLN